MNTTIHNNTIQENNSLYDVIISGAGPVGLFLACELALAKCSVLILEKAEDPNSPLKQLPFGIRGLTANSIELLDRRGLLQELEIHKRISHPHMNAAQGKRRQAGHFAGIPFHDEDIDITQWKHRLRGAADTLLISEIQELEHVLSRRAESLGVHITRGISVDDFYQNADTVTALTRHRSFKARWLVGCDGSRSVVRKKGGFAFVGTEPEFTGYSVKLDLADPEKLMPGRNFTSAGMYLQSQPGYLMIQDFDGGAFHGSGHPITLEHLQTVLRRVSETDVTIRALQFATTWTDRARQATSYRKGRVLLAGDAAHIHAPLGGQGLNLGLGDAMNLGWKLAATLHHRAAVGLLDTYSAERHPVGAEVLDWSRAQAAIMKPDANSRALRAIIKDLVNTRDGATYFAGRVRGVYTRYDLGMDHSLVGRSVPNFESYTGTRTNELMHEGNALLLDFRSDALLKSRANQYNEQISYVPGQVRNNLGANAVLIRPDGIVAWASDYDADYNGFQKAVDRWWKS